MPIWAFPWLPRKSEPDVLSTGARAREDRPLDVEVASDTTVSGVVLAILACLMGPVGFALCLSGLYALGLVVLVASAIVSVILLLSVVGQAKTLTPSAALSSSERIPRGEPQAQDPLGKATARTVIGRLATGFALAIALLGIGAIVMFMAILSALSSLFQGCRLGGPIR